MPPSAPWRNASQHSNAADTSDTVSLGYANALLYSPGNTLSRNSLLKALRLCALALCLCAPPVQAQLLDFLYGSGPPDAARFGARMELGDIASARTWLDAGLDPEFVADRIGTGLMIGAATGNIALMELFIGRGAKPDRANAADETALMHAAWRGQLEAVKWLLGHGASINRAPMKWTALHYAVFAGHQEVVTYLLAQGANINARSTNGSSVLMMAIFEGHEQLARQLIAAGADTSIKNDNDDGALEWAFKYKRPGLARLVADQKTYAEAAQLPPSYWGEATRSVSPTEGQAMQAQAIATATPPPQRSAVSAQIDELVGVRATLVEKGMTSSVQKLDLRINQLRAAQERARLQAQRSPAPDTNADRDSVNKGILSSPQTSQIDELMRMHTTLAARGMTEAAGKLDTRIAALRMKRAKPDLEAPDGAVLRITAIRPTKTGAKPPQ